MTFWTEDEVEYLKESYTSNVPMEEINTNEGMKTLIDSKERIQKTLLNALNHYGDRLKYVGPDCGLSGWTPPSIAFELLKRVHDVIEEVKKDF